MLLPCLLLAVVLHADTPADWRDVVQKPYTGLVVPDLGLRPLLVTEDGKPVTTAAEWRRTRETIQETWLGHLGKPSPKAGPLDVRVEKEEILDGYGRQLLSFASEGNDRILAYLLVPARLKRGEKRPAIVVFHQRSADTLKEPVGLGKKLELALALQLVRRGYVTLSPQCTS
jgi:hypothetical protein